jgi:hypothetical protein
MKRLTGWDNGFAYIKECFQRNNTESPCEHIETDECVYCEHYHETFRRLAEYEDTDLMPEEVKKLKEELFRFKNPLKPIRNKKIDGIGKCPKCKTELCIDDGDLHFCPTCGQALCIEPPVDKDD